MIRILLIATLMFAPPAALVHAAGSGEVRLYQESDRVDPREVARILGGQPSEPIRTRSIRMLDDAPAGKNPSAEARSPKVASALALPIQFAFDSAEILPRARSQLDALAQGVRMLDPDRKVTIEGHTDAKGGEQYNLELSRRRALAVKQYLVDVAGIEPSRLTAVGMGKAQPYDENNPFAAENRRVQFRGN